MQVVFVNSKTRSNLLAKVAPITEGSPSAGFCATVGNFDGVHIGHQALLQKNNEVAASSSLTPAVITFDVNTKKYFNQQFKLLNNFQQKLRYLKQCGIKQVFVLDFHFFSQFSAKKFIEFIVKSLGVRQLTVGADFHIGKDRVGLTQLLGSTSKELSTQTNWRHPLAHMSISINPYANFLEFYILPNKTTFNITENAVIGSLKDERSQAIISSSEIRKYIQEGRVSEAAQSLSYNFSVYGEVIKGNQLGRKLGFPTANLLLKDYIEPKFGVYASRVTLKHNGVEKKYDAVSSFGLRPTIAETTKVPILETYIFDFAKNVYGKTIKVELLQYIREELKFKNLEDLKYHIQEDVKKAKAICRLSAS